MKASTRHELAPDSWSVTSLYVALHWSTGACCIVSIPSEAVLAIEAAKRRGESIRVVITTHPPEVNRGIRGWIRKLRRAWQAFRKEMRHG